MAPRIDRLARPSGWRFPHHPFLALVFLASLIVLACGDGEAELTGASPSPDATTTARTPTLTPSINEGTTPSPETTQPQPAQTPPTSQPPAGDALSFAELWQRRTERIGEEVLVEGTVLFTFVCPPEPAAGGCVATAYLVDDSTLDILPSDSTPKIALYEEGKSVECTAQTLAGLNCRGWEHRRRYRVSGELNYEIGGGPSANVSLEVHSKELL